MHAPNQTTAGATDAKGVQAKPRRRSPERCLYAESRLRPFAFLRASTLRPPTVLIRFRKPCLRLRFRTLGWYVRLSSQIEENRVPRIVVESGIAAKFALLSSSPPEELAEHPCCLSDAAMDVSGETTDRQSARAETTGRMLDQQLGWRRMKS